VAQRIARGAHNSEVIGSKPISGIVKLDAINAAHIKTKVVSFYRSGAAEARGAHNPEVIGSNPISGIVKLDAINAASASSFYSRIFILPMWRSGSAQGS
jgi:hypothetical protein